MAGFAAAHGRARAPCRVLKCQTSQVISTKTVGHAQPKRMAIESVSPLTCDGTLVVPPWEAKAQATFKAQPVATAIPDWPLASCRSYFTKAPLCDVAFHDQPSVFDEMGYAVGDQLVPGLSHWKLTAKEIRCRYNNPRDLDPAAISSRKNRHYCVVNLSVASHKANVPAHPRRARDAPREIETQSRDSVQPVCSASSFVNYCYRRKLLGNPAKHCHYVQIAIRYCVVNLAQPA